MNLKSKVSKLFHPLFYTYHKLDMTTLLAQLSMKLWSEPPFRRKMISTESLTIWCPATPFLKPLSACEWTTALPRFSLATERNTLTTDSQPRAVCDTRLTSIWMRWKLSLLLWPGNALSLMCHSVAPRPASPVTPKNTPKMNWNESLAPSLSNSAR